MAYPLEILTVVSFDSMKAAQHLDGIHHLIAVDTNVHMFV